MRARAACDQDGDENDEQDQNPPQLLPLWWRKARESSGKSRSGRGSSCRSPKSAAAGSKPYRTALGPVAW